jgi:hypothetical protein
LAGIWGHLDHHVKVRLPITLGVVLASVLVTGVLTSPSRRTPLFSPAQPIAFPHDRHAGTMHIDCRYCHIGVETGRFATVPSSQICMNCHSVAMIDRPGVAMLRAEYAAGRPIAWKRVYKLPDFVYFSHDVHIPAGATCDLCHGDVTQAVAIRQILPLSMGNCIGCHRSAESRIAGARAGLRGPDDCSACHR